MDTTRTKMPCLLQKMQMLSLTMPVEESIQCQLLLAASTRSKQTPFHLLITPAVSVSTTTATISSVSTAAAIPIILPVAI